MRSAQRFSTILNDFIGLFFPSYCLGCNLSLTKSEKYICTHCKANLHYTNLHKNQPNLLHAKLFEIKNLDYAMSYCWFQKSGIIQKILFNLKYEANPELGIYLGEIYGTELAAYGFENKWDYVTYVPLHPKKLKLRGYNQSEMIAKGLAHKLNLPLKPLIKKSLHNQTQTKKSRIQRYENVENLFITTEQLKQNLRILIVDDVMTTGATIQAAAKPLIEYAAKVSVLTIAVVK